MRPEMTAEEEKGEQISKFDSNDWLLEIMAECGWMPIIS